MRENFHEDHHGWARRDKFENGDPRWQGVLFWNYFWQDEQEKQSSI